MTNQAYFGGLREIRGTLHQCKLRRGALANALEVLAHAQRSLLNPFVTEKVERARRLRGQGVRWTELSRTKRMSGRHVEET